MKKTETVNEFLARGGKITYVAAPSPKKKRAPRDRKQGEESADEINTKLIPANLKIALGIKD